VYNKFCNKLCRESNTSEFRKMSRDVIREEDKRLRLEKRILRERLRIEIKNKECRTCQYCNISYLKVNGRTKFCSYVCSVKYTNRIKDSKKLDKKYGEFRECSKLCSVIEQKEYKNEKINS
jgi:hypothetical protein